MTIRYVCDECANDISGKVWGSNRPRFDWGDGTGSIISGFLTLSKRNTWNDGHYCSGCIAKRLRKLADDLEEGLAREHKS